jgi:3-oxoacyl-[acyl-carrier protein] reductase
MIKRRSGVIINFSGGGATSSRPNFSAYATAKAGIVKFTEVLADELKPYRIRINAIAPGAVNTKMLDEILKIGRKAGNVELAAAKKRALEGGISAELAAELAVFLASSDSANLSGRLVSAVWDDWKHWSKKYIKKIMAGESLTLRRVK